MNEERNLEIEKLPLETDVYYISNFLTKEEADDLFDFCRKNLPFAQHKVEVYNRLLDQPRLTCIVGPKTYTYSGLTLNGTPIPKEMEYVLDRITEVFEDHSRPNAILCNLYRSGKEYISPHADKEDDLVKDCCIFSLSLGAVRHFDIYDKISGEKIRQDLEHGSLLSMGVGTQQKYKHGVPKQLTVKDERINLTFRVVKKFKNE